MKKQVLYRAAAATVLGLSLTTGVAAADANHYQQHHDKGNKGSNSLTANLSANVSNVGVDNSTTQNAYSGNANVSGGSNNSKDHNKYDKHDDKSNDVSKDNSATTGPAKNSNDTSGKVVVDQSAPAPVAGSSNQGSNDNHDKSGNNSVDVNASLNVSNVEVDNTTTQQANSGNANVTGNNSGGSATTGKASNSNSSSFTVVVKQ